ncbi:uncharacterized protein LOC110717008 [Chenopodium quinoa]|uniref:uncharacterized protein LOC110717008 n=1 Tax=Chenopodium quinoa TaxID=63459 RepID=UPI000B76C944|nr:uncharacterized protein LOC110717008 [Chenopodium quinoa]
MVGRNNNNNDLNKVVRQLATVAQQLAERNNNNNPDPTKELFKKIAQIACPNESKVSSVAYYLRGEADLWWQQNEQAVRALPKFGWNVFKEQVRDKFYPIFLQKQKADEFLELKMGSMSVTKYYTKFVELSRFAEDTVATDRQKARREAHLHALELKEKSEKTELEAREKRKEPMTSFGPSGNQNNFKKQKFNNHQGNNFKNNRNNQGGRNFPKGNRNQPRLRNQRIYYCKRCSNNHPGKDCEGTLVTCNQCNKQGHRAYECLSKNKGGQGNNQFKGSGQNWNQQKGGQGSNGNQVNKGAQFQNGNENTIVVTHKERVEHEESLIATYSFISKAMLPKLSHCLKTVDDIDTPLEIPTGGVVHYTRVYKDVPIKIKEDPLKTAQGELVTHWRNGKPRLTKIISVMKLAKYMKKRNPIYFCSVRNLEYEEPSKPKDIEVVKEFLNVFPEEILSMPPIRTIDLILGT